MPNYESATKKFPAPHGNQMIKDSDEILRALVDMLELWTPDMGDIKFSYQPADHGRWVLANGRNNLLRSAYPTAFVNMMIAAGHTGTDGSHFGVPNATDKFIQGASGSHLLGASGGAATVTLTEAQIPAHDHDISQNPHDHPANASQDAHTHTLGGGGGRLAIYDNDDVNNAWVYPQLTTSGVQPYACAVSNDYHNWLGMTTDGASSDTAYADVTPANADIDILDAGGGGSHNNLPPFLNAYPFIFIGPA